MAKMRLPGIDVLGPGAWYMLHFRAARCDTSWKVKLFSDDFAVLARDFCCGKCGKHMHEYQDSTPIDVTWTARQLLEWTFDLHQKLQLEHGKPGATLDDVCTTYLPVQQPASQPGGGTDEECEAACVGVPHAAKRTRHDVVVLDVSWRDFIPW